MEKNKDMVNMFRKLKWQHILDNGLIVKEMEKVRYNIQMDLFIKELLKII